MDLRFVGEDALRRNLRSPTLTIGDNKSNAGIAGDVDLSSGIAGGYVVKLGGYCFQNNSSLTGFKSGAELIETGNNAFQNCSALTNADLSASTGLTALSSSLFNGCKKLRRVAIPSTIATIGSSAFQNCSELEMDVNDLLPPGLSGPLYRTFYSCPKLYGDVVLPAGVTAISGDFAKSAITSFRTAEGSALAAIGHSAGYAEDATFSGCAALIATFYGQNNHFQNCSALVNLTLPGITAPSGHVVSGGGGAKDWSSTFRDCLVLTNAFTIPDDVTRLTQTFDGSKCIRGVALGKSVRQIGNFSNSESAFTDNRALEFVDMSATTNLTDIGQLNFSSCQALQLLLVPGPPRADDSQHRDEHRPRGVRQLHLAHEPRPSGGPAEDRSAGVQECRQEHGPPLRHLVVRHARRPALGDRHKRQRNGQRRRRELPHHAPLLDRGRGLLDRMGVEQRGAHRTPPNGKAEGEGDLEGPQRQDAIHHVVVPEGLHAHVRPLTRDANGSLKGPEAPVQTSDFCTFCTILLTTRRETANIRH